MIFSEIYGAYYTAVAEILKIAVNQPIDKKDISDICQKYAFSESVLSIAPALFDERWQLLLPDGTTPIKHEPSIPLSKLQKRWLKAISNDPRIRLFGDIVPELDDVEPLFSQSDIYVFDKYGDGDNFENESYIQNFRLILQAIKMKMPLSIETTNRKGKTIRNTVLPKYLEYSEKDDKFRLYTTDKRYSQVINLSKIVSCRPCADISLLYKNEPLKDPICTVTIELYDGRNALERVMLHFAHFEKEAERIDEKHYRLKINYNKSDETEMVIRILSFGPLIKVTEPESFVNLIKERLKMQKSCGL